jgi:hypothetical protein
MTVMERLVMNLEEKHENKTSKFCGQILLKTSLNKKLEC